MRLVGAQCWENNEAQYYGSASKCSLRHKLNDTNELKIVPTLKGGRKRRVSQNRKVSTRTAKSRQRYSRRSKHRKIKMRRNTKY